MSLIFAGAYTQKLPHVDGQSDGLHSYWLDEQTGSLTLASQLPGMVNPSYAALSPQKNVLYAVHETASWAGQPGGGLSALAIAPRTGQLTLLNQQPTHGADPCHVSLTPNGRYALVANYSGGSLAIYPVQPDGRLAPASTIIQHSGSGPHPQRQEAPHPHCILPSPDGRFLFVVDLGLDAILAYRLDEATGQLTPAATTHLPPGSGPRHLAWHPNGGRWANGRFAFVIAELANTLTVLAYQDGQLLPQQTISTLPSSFTDPSYCAAVKVAPSGRFVYGSNRGHDSIASFAFDEVTGRLTAVGHTPTHGQFPRDFAIDPSGRWLLAANQNSSTLVLFRLDAQTGQLTPFGQPIASPTPVCVTIVPE